MKQEQFEALHAADWQLFEDWLADRQLSRKNRKEPPFPLHEAALRYRRICQQLALARDRDYALATLDRLHNLARRGHDELYGARRSFGRRTWDYVTAGFAIDVRAQWRWVLASFLLLFGPMLIAFIVVQIWPDVAYLVMSPHDVAGMEAMYSDANQHLGRTRDAGTDFGMFGHYIFNNISIAFRCFAGGMTAGILTVFSLLFNGLFIGIAHSRVVLAGFGDNFHSFVVGHGTFELGAIVLAGATGMQLGAALLAPGLLSRAAALRTTARRLIGTVCGMAVMLFIAALLEAFWSPLRLPLPWKLGFGTCMLIIVMTYFIFAGRRRGS
ncbi:stage II sporulation protein M [Viridibacterium curvum]|uniref:Stage II sporulation protein M n=1 Tax=Viridibacterium curvum TaxID=1101404 RepID=A0ABP9QJJ3_9RHOO